MVAATHFSRPIIVKVQSFVDENVIDTYRLGARLNVVLGQIDMIELVDTIGSGMCILFLLTGFTLVVRKVGAADVHCITQSAFEIPAGQVRSQICGFQVEVSKQDWELAVTLEAE